MTTDSDVELVQRVFDAVNDRDWQRYAGYHADGFVIHGWERDLELDDWVDHMQETMLPAFPDVRFHTDELFAAGDRVVMRYHVTGTHEGEYEGVEATGAEVSYPGIAVFRVKDGQIAEVWPVVDRGRILEQVGSSSG